MEKLKIGALGIGLLVSVGIAKADVLVHTEKFDSFGSEWRLFSARDGQVKVVSCNDGIETERPYDFARDFNLEKCSSRKQVVLTHEQFSKSLLRTYKFKFSPGRSLYDPARDILTEAELAAFRADKLSSREIKLARSQIRHLEQVIAANGPGDTSLLEDQRKALASQLEFDRTKYSADEEVSKFIEKDLYPKMEDTAKTHVDLGEYSLLSTSVKVNGVDFKPEPYLSAFRRFDPGFASCGLEGALKERIADCIATNGKPVDQSGWTVVSITKNSVRVMQEPGSRHFVAVLPQTAESPNFRFKLEEAEAACSRIQLPGIPRFVLASVETIDRCYRENPDTFANSFYSEARGEFAKDANPYWTNIGEAYNPEFRNYEPRFTEAGIACSGNLEHSP